MRYLWLTCHIYICQVQSNASQNFVLDVLVLSLICQELVPYHCILGLADMCVCVPPKD